MGRISWLRHGRSTDVTLIPLANPANFVVFEMGRERWWCGDGSVSRESYFKVAKGSAHLSVL